MQNDSRTIDVDEASELAKLLGESDIHPLRIRAGNASYRVIREDAFPDVDPSAFNAAIDRLAGSWSEEDADAAITYIYTAREEGSRPANRP